jgi:large subunit ribosomal protein L5
VKKDTAKAKTQAKKVESKTDSKKATPKKEAPQKKRTEKDAKDTKTIKEKTAVQSEKTEKIVDKEKSETKKKVASKKGMKSSDYLPLYRKLYDTKIVPSLMKKFNYKSVMEVPRLKKITLNMGIGDAKNNSKALESAVNELTLISGQKAVVTHAKKDVSNFKIRRGFPVGCTVNIRGNRMYEFFERLNSIALPRTRDFTGLSFKSFDKRGNYNFGIKEQIVFTEIDYDKIDAIRGLDVAISTTAKTDEESYVLLKEFGFPLREKPQKKSDNGEEN